MATIKNFPYQYTSIAPPNDNVEFYPQYMQYLCVAILQATDYTQIPNSGLLNVDQFAVYRQQIRELMWSNPQTLVDLPVCPTDVR